MTASIRIPQAVQWHEGMFLSPHHFQQQQIYYERLQRHLMEQAQPFYWGNYHLEVDTKALRDGLIIVEKLHCVMPDGLVVEYDAEHDDNAGSGGLRLDVKNHPDVEEDQRYVTVQIAVPVRGPGAASAANSAINRFASEEDEPVPDENTGENLVGVIRLKPRLYLLPLERPSSRFISMPLFRLDRQHTGVFRLADYQPPILRMKKEEFVDRESLGKRVANIVRQARIKAHRLSQVAGAQLGGSINDTHAISIANMVAGLPGVEVLLASGRAHPFQIYQALAQLNGQLAALRRGSLPPELPPYDHDDMQAGFKQALDFIVDELSGVNLSYTSISFERDEAGVFRLAMKEGWEDRPVVFELKTPSGVEDKAVREWLEACMICTESSEEELRRQRQLGAPVEYIEADIELDVRTRPGATLCRVNWQDPYVRPGETLLLACTSEELSNKAPEAILYYRPFRANDE